MTEKFESIEKLPGVTLEGGLRTKKFSKVLRMTNL